MNNLLTAAQIRARLLSSDNVYGPEGSDEMDEWGDAFSEFMGALPEFMRADPRDVLVAWTHAQENHDGDVTYDPAELGDKIRETYKGYHDSAWEFARDTWAVDLQEYGSQGERKGREAFMNDFSSYIDWRAVADSPLLSEFTMVRMDGDDDARVHVFEIQE